MRWSWHGVAGVILTACVGVGWTATLIIMALQGRPINDLGAGVLNTLGGALIGAVSTWLGMTAVYHHHNKE